METTALQALSAPVGFQSDYKMLLGSLVKQRVVQSSRATEIVECKHVSDKSLDLVLISRSKQAMTEQETQLVAHEIAYLQKLVKQRLPGVARVYAAFETEEAYCHVMDSYKTNLHKELEETDGFPLPEEEVCNDILQPLLKALASLHRQQIIHRDVRLENLLIGEEGVKLSGFQHAQSKSDKVSNLLVGDKEYNAPEMIRASKSKAAVYDEKVDVWAAGIVTYRLLFGQTPFHSETDEELERLILEGSLPGFMGFLSTECQDFLHLALRKNADERPSAESLLRHPWLTHHLQMRSKTEIQQKDGKIDELPLRLNAPWISNIITPNQSLSPRMGTWKISSHKSGIPGEYLMSSDSEASASLLAHLEVHSPTMDSDREGADDILPKSPVRRQGSWSSRASSRESSEVLSYVEAAPQLEELREEAALDASHHSASPDIIHLEHLGATEANAAPTLLPTLKHVRRQGSLGKSRFAYESDTEQRSP